MQSTFVRKLAAGVTIAGLLLSAVPTFASGTGPSVTLSTTASSPTGTVPIPVTATISTSTSNFNAGNVSVTNGTLSGFSGSGTTYTFNVTPTVAVGDPDGSHYVIQIVVNDNAFDGNQPSNTLTIGYDPTMASSSTGTTTGSGSGTGTTTSSGGSSSGTQSIAIIGPNSATTDGTTVMPASGTTTAAVSFTFTSTDASSTLWCSIAGQTSADSFYMCGSPQNYTLPVGDYRFSVQASNGSGTTSASRLFTIGTASSTTTGSTTTSGGTDTSTSGGSSSGSTSSGGGGSTTTTPPRSVESGNGSAVGGPPAGHTVIPTGFVAVIPTTPVAQSNSSTGSNTTASNTSTTGSTATTPVVSQSSGGSALVGSNSPSTSGRTTTSSTGASTGSTVTPGTPNTGSDITTDNMDGSSMTVPDQSLLPATNSLTAAAANSGGGIPGWVWLVLAAIVLIGIGVWAVRQPA